MSICKEQDYELVEVFALSHIIIGCLSHCSIIIMPLLPSEMKIWSLLAQLPNCLNHLQPIYWFCLQCILICYTDSRSSENQPSLSALISLLNVAGTLLRCSCFILSVFPQYMLTCIFAYIMWWCMPICWEKDRKTFGCMFDAWERVPPKHGFTQYVALSSVTTFRLRS